MNTAGKTQVQKNAKTTLPPEDLIKSIEKELFNNQSTLNSSISRIVDGTLQISEVGRITENILNIIPIIRKKTAMLKIEKAFQKYGKMLVDTGVNPALIDFIVKKRREKVAKKLFMLDPDSVTAIEKKLKIFTGDQPDDADIFIKLNNILARTKELDEIEIVVRKIRSKLEAQSKKTIQLEKEDVIRHFADEGGFEEKGAVIEFLFHKNLTEAIHDEVVTQKKLTYELQNIEGKLSKISKYLLESFNKKYSTMEESMKKELPLSLRITSNYITTPIVVTAGTIGTLTIIIYSLGKFGMGLLLTHLPKMAEILNATGIPAISSMLEPAPVFIVGFGCIFVAGLVKMLDEKLKKNSFRAE